MKRKVFVLINLFIALMLLIVFACEDDVTAPIEEDLEELTVDEVEMLDNMEEAEGFELTTVVLPNGEILYDYLMEHDPDFLNELSKTENVNNDPYENMGPQAARNLLIAKMTAAAINLVDRSKHQYANEGTNRPAQNGLAYGYGNKDYTARKKPGGGSQCSHEIYGLDCSGFIYQLFQKAGVNMINGNANSQRDTATIESKIKSSIPALDKIKAEDLGMLATSRFESGDIVYWVNENGYATHIGIVLKEAGSKLSVFQSNGGSGKTDLSDCDRNLTTARGPRKLKLNSTYWFGGTKKYGIVRINADLSGKWTLYLRCAGYATDAITLNLDFPTVSTNDFIVNGTGTDYDGTPLNCTINMNYNNKTNVLSGVSHITSPSSTEFYRYDSFTVKLDKDETDYVSFTLGDSQYAGCEVEGRFVNNENNSAGKSSAASDKNGQSEGNCIFMKP